MGTTSRSFQAFDPSLLFDPDLEDVVKNNRFDLDLVSRKVLEDDRKVYLDNEINNKVLSIQRLLLRWNKEDIGIPREERKPIRIYIMSYGGELDYMWSLVDSIALSETPVYTINMGIAASAASLIFIAGHQRYMLPNSELIIHEGSAQMSGDAVKIFDNVDNYKELVRKMKLYILERSTVPAALMNKKRNNDWHVNAETCYKYKMCDRIIESMEEII